MIMYHVIVSNVMLYVCFLVKIGFVQYLTLSDCFSLAYFVLKRAVAGWCSRSDPSDVVFNSRRL